MCEEIYENFYLTSHHNGNITTENGTSEQKWTIVHLAGSFGRRDNRNRKLHVLSNYNL